MESNNSVVLVTSNGAPPANQALPANGNGIAAKPLSLPIEFSRASFPAGFVFGTAGASYQYEGAAREGGRGPSIWDTFTRRLPGKIADGSNGNMAVNFYYRFKEDVRTMKRMGLDAFRFSISWSRILPHGKISRGVNQEGIQFYNDLIDEILANGMIPFATIFHWDLPQTLEDEYGGFRSPLIVQDFVNYCELLFWEFGDRVKYWITLNEPWSYSYGGYVTGNMAPGRGAISEEQITPIKTHRLHRHFSHQLNENGDPATEPYLVTHYQLLAHAAAVKLYRTKFQVSQKGKIGITLVVQWMVPYTNSEADKAAAQRSIDFFFGWFMDPLATGDYPRSMRKLVRERLPEFSEKQAKLVKDSYDFLGINYYTATYVADDSNSNVTTLSYATDSKITYYTEKDGVPIGPQAGSSWLLIYPVGFYDTLMYIKDKYNNPVIYITENGCDEMNNIKLTVDKARVDPVRKKYHIDHLRYLKDAIDDGVKVQGYFQWSFMDNFEWASGYESRFGMTYVDFKDGYFTRYPKESAVWFMNFLKKELPPIEP